MLGDLNARFYDDAIQNHVTGKLIDLGCGKVPLYDSYQANATEITCVDWAAPSEGENHLDFICDLSEPLPFESDRFQTIILSDVLEHVSEPQALWVELARILSPGGKLLMNTPFMYCLHEQPHDYYRFTSHALRRFAETNGFKVLHLEPIGGALEVLADITAKHLQFVPVVGKLLARGVQGFVFWLVNTGPGKSMSRKSKDVFPLGYGMIVERTT